MQVIERLFEPDEAKNNGPDWCPHCGAPLRGQPMVVDAAFDDARMAINRHNGSVFILTKQLWLVLCALRRAFGRTVGYDYISSWATVNKVVSNEHVGVLICHVRKALEDTDFIITNSPGIGYRLERRNR